MSREGWSSKVIRPGEDADAADIDFWLQIPRDDRAGVAWLLSVEAWSLRPEEEPHGEPDESGLRGFPARVIRP